MNQEEKNLIGKATESLQLENLFIYESKFNRLNDIPSGVEDFQQMIKRSVGYSLDEDEDGNSLLSIKVDLGVRLIEAAEEIDPDSAFIEIEADFIVQYLLLDEVPDDALKAFSEFNGVHNAWPFWRQHVFDVVQRGNLPKIEVPLFSGDQ